MPTSNEELRDAVLRHQIYLLRYSGSVRNRILALLDATEDSLAEKIMGRLGTTRGLDGPADVQRMRSLLAALESIRTSAWDKAWDVMYNEMVNLAYQEPVTLGAMVGTVAPVVVTTVLPAQRMLRAIVVDQPFEGRVLKDWARGMQADDLRRIHREVQMGMVAGESSADIARRVVGTKLMKGADGTTQATRQQVESVTRTAVQHVANSSRDAFMRDNADLFTQERFTATLDSRTTPVCRACDGKLYPIGTGPRPPLHFGCRSCRIAVLDGVLLGQRPAKPTTEKILVGEYAALNKLGPLKSRDDLPRGTKGAYDEWARKRMRQLVGPVPAEETYQTWMKKQSNEFQAEVLGVAKAKLFREGGLTLDKFVNRAGDELTLPELAKKHAQAFRAAGLDPAAF